MNDMCKAEELGNMIHKIVNCIIDEFTEKQEDFIFQQLEPFGITKENIMDYKERFEILVSYECESEFRAFYLDGFYLFTIETVNDTKEEDGRYFLEQTCKVWSRAADAERRKPYIFGVNLAYGKDFTGYYVPRKE